MVQKGHWSRGRNLRLQTKALARKQKSQLGSWRREARAKNYL